MSDLPPNFGISASEPPKKDSPPSVPKPNRTTQVNLIVTSLEKTYSAIGMALMIVNQDDAKIVAGNASELAESWRSLLENNPKVRASFMKMMEASGWSTVIMAHMMVALPLFRNHKDSFDHLTNKKSKAVRDSRMAETPTTPTL